MKGGVLTHLPLWAQTSALVVVCDLDAGQPAAQPSITWKTADRWPRADLPGQQREHPGSPASDQATLLQLRARGLPGFFPCRPTPPCPPALRVCIGRLPLTPPDPLGPLSPSLPWGALSHGDDTGETPCPLDSRWSQPSGSRSRKEENEGGHASLPPSGVCPLG